MAITITLNGTTMLDESSLLQNATATPGVTGDDDDNDVSLSRLQNQVQEFYDRLFATIANGGLALSTTFPAGGRVAESASNFIEISATGTTGNVAFTDSTGAALNGADSGLDALADDANILLYTDTNDNIVLGKASTDGRVVFAAYVEEIYDNENNLIGAKIWMVTFEAIEHLVNTDPDDAIAILANRLFVSVSEELNFDLSTLASGQNQWNAFGDASNQIIVIADQAGQTVNTSKGGGQTTIGNTNQLLDGVDPGKDTDGEAMVFTFVTNSPGLFALDKSVNNNIDYSSLLPATAAEWSLSQTQGGSPFAVATVVALSTTKETGNTFVSGLNNDTVVTIDTVTIRDGNGNILLEAVDNDLTTNTAETDSVPRTVGKGGNQQTFNLSVTFNGDGTVTISGLQAKDSIAYTTTEDHNRVKLWNTGIDANTLDWDIGGFKLTEVASEREDVGPALFIEDGGPEAGAGATITVEEDDLNNELSVGNNEDGSTNAHTATQDLGVLVNPGPDAPASFALDPTAVGSLASLSSKGQALSYDVDFSDNGTPANETDDFYTLWAFVEGDGDSPADYDPTAGTSLDRLVFSWKLEVDGDSTLTLNDQVDHAAGNGENTLTFNPTAIVRAFDAEGDPASLTDIVQFAIVDDVPVQNSNTATGVVEEEELTGGNEDETSDVTPDLDTDPSPAVTAVATGSLANLVNIGTDEPPTFSLSATGATAPTLSSGGTSLKYSVNLAGDTLTGYLDNDGSNTLNFDDTPIFTFQLSGTNKSDWAFTLLGVLDHPGAGEDVLSIDVSSYVRATDRDGDTITLDSGSAVMKVIDDKPTVSANSTVQLDDDALTGGNAGGTGDDANALNTSGTLGHSYGADGAGTVKLLGAGLPTSSTTEGAFIQSVNGTGTELLIKQIQGGAAVTVLTVALSNTTGGAYTVAQNATIRHATGNNENNQSFTVGYRVTDGDNDTVDGTLGLDVDDDSPLVTVDDLSGTFTTAVQSSTWSDLPGADGFKSLNVTLNQYKIDDNAVVVTNTSLGTLTTTDGNGNYVFTGSITDDFTNDGVANNQTVNFKLTFDPDADTYDFELTTPPSTITTFDTTQGSLKAGGPDRVQTLEFAPAGHTNDVIFFGAVATAPIENGSTGSDPNDIEDLVSGDPTESTLEGLSVPNLISASTKMNVSTSGIGINNNNLNGASEGAGTGAFAGTTITSGDQSFVVNPEEDVVRVTVYIDNSVGGYTPATEDLYYTVYFTDGTTTGPVDVNGTTVAIQDAPRKDPLIPDVAEGGKFFVIEASTGKEIEAVQLTMGEGVVKIPVIQFSVATEFDPEPLDMDFTATLFDKDDDSATDTFAIDLVDPTV